MLRAIVFAVLAHLCRANSEFVQVRSGHNRRGAAREVLKANVREHKPQPIKLSQKRMAKVETHVQGYLLGLGFCLNLDSAHGTVVDFLGDHMNDCVTLCHGLTDFPCHAYAVGTGICKLYASNAVQAQRPGMVTEEEINAGVKCYVLKQTFNADFPQVSVSESDFLGCFNGQIPPHGTVATITYITSITEYVHARSGDEHGNYANFCAKQCQRFSYFLLKSHVTATGRGSNKCYCVERYDHAKGIDRFVGDAYFGTKLGNEMCPTWNCAYHSAGCVWHPDWDLHVAMYRNPLPHDGDPCPDHQSAHGHHSSFIFVGGSNGKVASSGWYREKVAVSSPSACAELCFYEGPSVRGRDDSKYNETCHGYYAHRDRKLDLSSAYVDDSFNEYNCWLYNNPIPHYEIPTYLTYTDEERASGAWTNYLCVLRTCIEDTPCSWNSLDNYRRVEGFKYTKNSTRIEVPDTGVKHCEECATQCSGSTTCSAYQCSISTNHCYLFSEPKVDVDVQVSDVSFCIKSSALRDCLYQNGAKGVLQSEEPCNCGGAVCQVPEYCVVHNITGTGECVTYCPCVYAAPPTVADAVCSTTNETYASECELHCANATLAYPGICIGNVCPVSSNGTLVGSVTTDVNGTIVNGTLDACLCGGNGSTSDPTTFKCPVGSTCFSNGTCTPNCEELAQEGETLVCGTDGTEYTSRCSLPTNVTLDKPGPCPLPNCTSGQTECVNCVDANGNCTAGANGTTRCVLECTLNITVAGSCGCRPPCQGLDAANAGNHTEMCGCDTTEFGYVVCDGHCFVNATSGVTSCVKPCPSSGDPSCVCGGDVCAGDLCDTAQGDTGTCLTLCENPDDTECFCRAPNMTSVNNSDTHLCQNGTLCSTFLNATLNVSSECVAQCGGRLTDNSTCFCSTGEGAAVCSPPDSYCSTNSSSPEAGKCVKGKCDNAETDCLCGEDTCLSDGVVPTYCNVDLQRCFPDCLQDGTETNCFCPNAQIWLATRVANTSDTRVCLSDDVILNALNNTYCTPKSNWTADAVCELHCIGRNGLLNDTHTCPCGAGVMCAMDQFCLHTEDMESGMCLNKVLNESCVNVTRNELELIGEASTTDSCWCGGMPCPEGSFCHLKSGTCSADRIQVCNTTEPIANQAVSTCRCGGDDILCAENEYCMPDVGGNTFCAAAMVRCQDPPQSTECSVLGDLYVVTDTSGSNSDCYCGTAISGGGFCTGDQICSTDNATATCQSA